MAYSIKNQSIKLSKLILLNKNKKALNLLNEMIEFKSKKPFCCSNCSGNGWKGSTGCKMNDPQSWASRLKQFKAFFIAHINGTFDPLNDPLPFAVFKQGNGKLPFINYSTIPVSNCPGAGACKTYCYSLNSMRFPTATCSWLQNQILENHYFNRVALEFKKFISKPKYAQAEKIDFRLYNDGDFSSKELIIKWMELLKDNKNISAYGYSKSLHLLKELNEEGYKWPKNYLFNISNGGKYDYLKNVEGIRNHPAKRGEFLAVPLGGKVNVLKITTEQRRQLKNNFPGEKIFICPGLCGSCTSRGQACGLDTFKDKKIVIPVH